MLSDKWRSVPHVAGWSVIVAAIVGIELTTMFALQNVASQREADGMNVVVSTADSGIMAIDCSALDRQHYVRRAGGVRNSRIISLDDLGGVDFVSATVTDRALQVLDPTLSMAQIGSTDGTAFLGSVLADELGLRPGETFAMHGKKVTVAGVLRSSVRAEAFDRWLLTTGPPTGMVDECWVEYDPGVRRISLGISSHVLSRGVADLESHELIRLDERSRSLAQPRLMHFHPANTGGSHAFICHRIRRPYRLRHVVGRLLARNRAWTG